MGILRSDSTGTGAATAPLNGPAGPHALVRQFTLRVTAGPDRGAVFSSRAARTVVGTHESTDFVLGDKAVSRFHCEIVLDGGRALLRDLGSRNGTRIGEVAVREAYLEGGAAIGLGETRIRFEFGRKDVAVPVSGRECFGRLVGRSEAMRAAFALLERAARSDATVLLEGETGVGKDLAAESIHGEGARAAGPFVVVDCGGVPGNLLESELFGHERGAFTGAEAARAGAFERAHGGTLFLDEVGELGADLQPKFLRVLETRKVTRVGGSKPVQADVRIVAASNRNLRAEVNAGRFRADLYYRLAVLPIRLPALRERLDDLPVLVGEILERLKEGAYPGSDADPARILRGLAQHDWPGNVRQLRNHVERALVLPDQAPPEEPPAPGAADAAGVKVPFQVARERALRDFERRYLEGLLAAHQGNVAAAARAAGIDRTYLHRLLSRAGLR